MPHPITMHDASILNSILRYNVHSLTIIDSKLYCRQ